MDTLSFAMLPETEKIFLDQARNGEERAFAQLVEAHSDRVIALAWRLVGHRQEAEEVAQEAFLRLYQSLATFRGESSIATWLYRTVSRLAIDHLRRERLKRKLFFFRGNEALEQPDPLETTPDASSPSPLDRLLAKELAGRMQQVLNQLPPQQKAVFVLRHLEERSLREIAEILGLEEGTVKTHLHRAVGRFRKEYRRMEAKS
jgi:RNA polymerase sigma-70 factor (ECF subfamily)